MHMLSFAQIHCDLWNILSEGNKRRTSKYVCNNRNNLLSEQVKMLASFETTVRGEWSDRLDSVPPFPAVWRHWDDNDATRNWDGGKQSKHPGQSGLRREEQGDISNVADQAPLRERCCGCMQLRTRGFLVGPL